MTVAAILTITVVIIRDVPVEILTTTVLVVVVQTKWMVTEEIITIADVEMMIGIEAQEILTEITMIII